MLQLVLVSCVSGTSRFHHVPNKKTTKREMLCNWSAWNSPSLLVQLWCYFWSNYTLPITSEIFFKQKTAPLKQRLEILHLPCHPWILARKKRQARRQLVIMTSLDLSSASWHPCSIMAARVDNIKYMKHFDVSSLCFCLFQNPGMTIFPNSVI